MEIKGIGDSGRLDKIEVFLTEAEVRGLLRGDITKAYEDQLDLTVMIIPNSAIFMSQSETTVDLVEIRDEHGFSHIEEMEG